MGITRTLASQVSNPHGALGWITAWLMPLLSDRYCGDLAKLLDLRSDDDVLDVGCGSGVFLHKRASQARHIAGIDQSDIQVRIARWRNRDRIAAGTAEIVQGDATALPWEDERFSATTCNCVNCFSSPLESLQEMHRVLSPGGRLALAIDYCPDEATARRQEQRWGLPSWTEAEFRTMIDDAGFSVVAISRAREMVFAKATRQ